MKLILQIVLISAVMLGLVAACLMFAFSDFGHIIQNEHVWQTKPWRPFARMALGFFLITFILIMGGALIRVSFKERSL